MCVCIALCTIVAHNIAQNRPDNFLSYPKDNHHCSDDVYLREGDDNIRYNFSQPFESQHREISVDWPDPQHCHILSLGNSVTKNSSTVIYSHASLYVLLHWYGQINTKSHSWSHNSGSQPVLSHAHFSSHTRMSFPFPRLSDSEDAL